MQEAVGVAWLHWHQSTRTKPARVGLDYGGDDVMRIPEHHRLTRRDFITGSSALGAASLLGLSSTAAAEPPPEVTSLRISNWSAICVAPQYVAETLLLAEGFTDVQYIEGIYPGPGSLL